LIAAVVAAVTGISVSIEFWWGVKKYKPDLMFDVGMQLI